MNTTRHMPWRTATVIGLLIAGAVISYLQMRAARDETHRAQQQHSAVTGAIQKIAALENQPDRASTSPERSDQLAQHIETTAAQCGITPPQIERVQTQAPRRIDDSPYLRQPTHVQLHQVSLSELGTLLYDLDPTGQNLQIGDLRLIAPHAQLVGDQWHIEFTVSYLMYQPAAEAPHRP